MWYIRLVHLIGACGLVLTALQIPALITGLSLGEREASGALLASIFICLFLSGAFFLGFRTRTIAPRRAAGVVLPVLAFVFAGMIAGLPFYFYASDGGFVRAFAQGIALITTAGGDYYRSDVSLPTSFQVWRGTVAWIGGFASIIMVLALYTQLNHGGVQLHRSSLVFGEFRPGMSRLRSLGAVIFPLYVAVTAVLVLALYATGTDLPKAMLFAAGAISGTGLSVGTLGPDASTGTLLVLSAGMLLALCNWDSLLTGVLKPSAIRRVDPEYIGVLFIIVLAFLVFLLVVDGGITRPDSALFLVLSALSGTGWVPANIGIDATNIYAGLGLLALAAIGGAAASTSGGLKGIRLIVLAQLGRAELERLAYPHRVASITVFNQRVRQQDIDAIWLLVASSVIAAIMATAIFAVMSWPVIDAVHMAITSLTLSGPLMDFISPAFAGFHALTPLETALTALLNLIGRVEVSVFLAMFVGQVWR